MRQWGSRAPPLETVGPFPRRSSAPRSEAVLATSMSSEADQPAAKRIRLDDPAAPASEPAAPVALASSLSSSSLTATFFRPDAPGLFGVLAASLGKRAATEEEVGVTQFIAPEVEPFAGIIKHRLSSPAPLLLGSTTPGRS